MRVRIQKSQCGHRLQQHLRLREMEARRETLRDLLAAPDEDVPDINPAIAGVYRRKVARLADALQHPGERDEAAAALKDIIERITLTPGARRGEMNATLHGDLRTILEWTERGKGKADTPVSGVS